MRVGCSTSYKVGRVRPSSITLLIRDSGTFAEITSVEHQLHWIIENAKLVRSVNGVSAIVEAMKIASSKYDLLW